MYHWWSKYSVGPGHNIEWIIDNESNWCFFFFSGKYCDQNEAIDEEQSGVGEPSHGVVTPKDCPAGKLLYSQYADISLLLKLNLCDEFTTFILQKDMKFIS